MNVPPEMEGWSVGVMGRVTKTVKLWVALIVGVPLSVTMTLIGFVLGLCAMVGRQLKMPLLEFNDEPACPPCKLNVNVCAGMFVSLALLVKLIVVPAMTVRLVMAASVGVVFDTGAFVVVIKTP